MGMVNLTVIAVEVAGSYVAVLVEGQEDLCVIPVMEQEVLYAEHVTEV